MRICIDLLDLPEFNEEVLNLLTTSDLKSIALQWKPTTADLLTNRKLLERGIAIDYLELPPFNCITESDLEKQTNQAVGLLKSLTDAGIQHIGVISSHAGSTGFDRMQMVLNRILRHAEDSDIKVSVRNVLNSAIEQVDSIRMLLREFQPSLGFCLDSLEFQRAIVNPADAVTSFYNRITLARIRDERDGKPCSIGSGTAHAEPTTQALKQEGFTGSLIVGLGTSGTPLVPMPDTPASPEM